MATQAQHTVQRRRQSCLDRYGAGVRLLDHPSSTHVELYRGRVLIARAVRHYADRRLPHLVDRLGWLLREARAWHTLTIAGRTRLEWTEAEIKARRPVVLGRRVKQQVLRIT